MTNLEWIEMFELIPQDQHSQIVLVMGNGTEVVVEIIFRFEKNYVVVRGRQGGTIEESRAFFIPYSELLYFRLERSVKISELYRLFGETPPEGIDKMLDDDGDKKDNKVSSHGSANGKSGTVVEAEKINKNQLLEKLRAVRQATASKANRPSSTPSSTPKTNP